MRIFKKRNRQLSVRQKQAAGKIADLVLKFQRKAAGYLNRKTAHLSGLSRLLLLILFCMVFGSYCLYLLIGAFH